MNRQKRNKLLLYLGISGLLSGSIFVVEWIGSRESGSLALLADAGHIAADIFAHAISFIAILLSAKKPTKEYPFGYYRFEVIAALFNGLLLILISVFILKESYIRYLDSIPIETHSMLNYSLVGLFLNLASAVLLYKVSEQNINVRSTYLHVLSDLLGTVAVVLGALIIQYTSYEWIDIALSVLLGIFILKVSFGIVKESVQILLEKEPHEFEKSHALKHILHLSGIVKVPEFLIRKLTSGIFSVEMIALVKKEANRDSLLLECHKILKGEFHVPYVKVEFLDESQWHAYQTIKAPEREWELEELTHSHGHDEGSHHHHHDHH